MFAGVCARGGRFRYQGGEKLADLAKSVRSNPVKYLSDDTDPSGRRLRRPSQAWPKATARRKLPETASAFVKSQYYAYMIINKAILNGII